MKTNEPRVWPGGLITEEAWAPLAAHCARAAASVLCGFAFFEEKKTAELPVQLPVKGEIAKTPTLPRHSGLLSPILFCSAPDEVIECDPVITSTRPSAGHGRVDA
jgi:hypothetical protein